MAERVNDQQLALLLQASRDFALQQMADGKRLIPFAARVPMQGEIEFVRFADETTRQPLGEIYEQTRAAMAREAGENTLLAASLVAAVEATRQDGVREQALRIHVEAPGFCRQILAPYAIEAAGEGEAKGSIALGQLQPVEAEAVIFSA